MARVFFYISLQGMARVSYYISLQGMARVSYVLKPDTKIGESKETKGQNVKLIYHVLLQSKIVLIFSDFPYVCPKFA